MPILKPATPFGAIVAFAQNKPLGDPALPSTPVSLQLPAQAQSFDLTAPGDPTNKLGSFSVSADAGAAVAIINAATDPDPVGYFNLGCTAAAAAEKAGGAPVLEPPAQFDPTLAYLVITALEVSGKLAGKFTIGTPATLALDGSDALDTSACMAFPKSTPVWTALDAALTQFKTIFSAGELTALTATGAGLPAPWQVLSFGVQSSANLSLKLTAASLAGQVAEAVNAALSRSGPFCFSASAAATVTVTLAASDGYRIFAHRATPGAVTFSLKKSSSTSLGLNAGLGLTVAISESDLTALVNAAFEQACGVADGAIAPLLAAGDTGALTADQKLALQRLLAKLGLSNAVGREVAALQGKLAAFRDDLQTRITPVVCAQFSYAWKRLSTESLVAQFSVPDAVLPKYHADILALNLDAVLATGAADGVVFARLLGQAVQQLDVGYGFSFGLDGYTFFKSWDSLQTKFVELKTVAPGGGWLRQDTFLGKRAYQSTWCDSSQCNYVELDAAMNAPSSAPAIGDFHPGLSVAFSWKGCRFGSVLPAVADFGAVIDTFDTDDVIAAQQALVAAGLDPGATGDALVTLTVDNAAMRRLLPALTGPAYLAQIAPHAMARALPFSADYSERSQVGRRMLVYAQVFADFLATEELAIDTVAQLCRLELPQVTEGGKVSTALIDGETDSALLAWTAQGVVAMADAGSLQQAVNAEIPACFAGLAQTSGDFRQVFPACVENFSTLAAQTFGTRIFAGMLLLAAMVTPGSSDLLARAVQFTWTDGPTRRTVVVKKGNT